MKSSWATAIDVPCSPTKIQPSPIPPHLIVENQELSWTIHHLLNWFKLVYFKTVDYWKSKELRFVFLILFFIIVNIVIYVVTAKRKKNPCDLWSSADFMNEESCWSFVFSILSSLLFSRLFIKGQLISKCPFGVIVWTKKPWNIFQDFCPSL